MADTISHDKVKINLARIKKFGETFEISIDPDAAVQYKKGEASLSEVLSADNIFSDAKRGLIASGEQLTKAFDTADTEKIADIILRQGEIQITSEHRAEEREQRKRKLINMINTQAIDPKSGLPHPPTRIEAALEEGKIHLLDHKSVEDQFPDIISKLRPIIPLSIEKKKLSITIPGSYAGKSQQAVRAYTIVSEDWLSNGGWKVVVELPAGLAPEFIDKLNSLTHGEVVVE